MLQRTYGKRARLIRNFIEKELKEELKEDQKKFKILSEGDLQSCVYYHLREFIDDKKITDWHVLNKLSMKKGGAAIKIPDIVIVNMRPAGVKVYPIFLIELKEDFTYFKSGRVEDDVKKLTKLAKEHGKQLEQTYFIYAILDENYTPEQIEKKIVSLKSDPDDGWLFPIAVNIMGEKQFPKEMKGFMDKVERLRKYRA